VSPKASKVAIKFLIWCLSGSWSINHSTCSLLAYEKSP
jgi:hypothetical protein